VEAFKGMGTTAPQEAHLPFLPAVEAGERIGDPHFEHENSRLSETPAVNLEAAGRGTSGLAADAGGMRIIALQ
jgi:hypothetical protein